MTIRPATRADLPRIWQIRHGVTENVLSDPSKVSDAEVAWYLEQAIFLVSEDDGAVAGFACANHQTGLIWALFVDPAREGQGHGSALIALALERLAASGHRQAFLNTGGDTRAARFYRAQGWRETGRDLDGQSVFVKPI